MPELAEVEKAKKSLQEICNGRTIADVKTFEDQNVYVGVTHTDFAAAVKGKLVQDVKRYGKWFYMELVDGVVAMMHFGMTGKVDIRGKETIEYKLSSVKSSNVSTTSKDCEKDRETHGIRQHWSPRFPKFIMSMDDGSTFAFCDARRLAKVTIVTLQEGESAKNRSPLKNLGFDPLLCMPEKEVFVEMIQQRRLPIKTLLLDQTFSAGIGNWIADECLYHARLHPERSSNSLSREEMNTLHEKIVYVVNYAVEMNAECSLFPKDWLFHYRWGKGKKEMSKTYDGLKIEHIKVGGRTSAFVPDLQKVSANILVGITRKRKAGLQLEENDEKDKANRGGGGDGNSIRRVKLKRKVKKKTLARKKKESEGNFLDDDQSNANEKKVGTRTLQKSAMRTEHAIGDDDHDCPLHKPGKTAKAKIITTANSHRYFLRRNRK